MKLVIGLGNPGPKHQNNRHNAGHIFVDYLINELKDSRINEFKEAKILKTGVFMNQSGPFVKKLVPRSTFHVSRDLIVVHDDLDIPLGKFKIQKGEGPRLHNGINSIEQALGSKEFWRVRIGVDDRAPRNWIDGETYVLQDFTAEEKAKLTQIFPTIKERLLTIIKP